MTELEKEIRIILQIALLGEVSPHLRAVAFSFGNASIHLDCFFDGEIAEEDRESMSLIETDLLAGYSETHEVSSALHRLDYPASIPGSKGWVYLRREDMNRWS